MRGKVFNLQRYSIHDGPGIRSTVFLSGCPLRCRWCCNPESFNISSPLHYEVEVKTLMASILEDKPYFLNSGGGVTLSGGEPLIQAEFATEILRECRRHSVGTAIETCGDVAPFVFSGLRGLVDYYLYDLKHHDFKKYQEFTSADAQRIWNNLMLLKQNNEKVIIRIPLIPGFNLNAEAAENIGKMVDDIQPEEVHLLPYHRLGENKYSDMGIEYGLRGTLDPMSYVEGKVLVKDFLRLIRKYSDNVYLGG